MGRISATFQALKRHNKTALIPFITAGDPEPRSTPAIMQTLAQHGADMLELGVPFSDPMADGPAIQQANDRALTHKVSLSDVLNMVAQFRRSDTRTPVILMGYLNPIEVFGCERFAREAAAAGVDGVIVVDMPPEEAASLNAQLRARELDQVFLIAPTTGESRIAGIAGMASGFLYYVAVKGTTGGKDADPSEVRKKLDMIRQKSNLPIAVGFGIKDAATARRLANDCDAVVIGSALVERIHAAQTGSGDVLADIRSFIAPVRQLLDKAA